MNFRRILYGLLRLFLCALLTLCFSACENAEPGMPSTRDTEQSISYSSEGQTDRSDASDPASEQAASDGSEATESGEESSRTDTSDTGTSQTSTDTVTTQSSSAKASSTSTQASLQKPNTSDTVNDPTEPEDLPEPPVYTNVSPVQPEDYYGLRWLSTQSNSGKMVTAYKELVFGIGKREDTISISSGITKDQLKTVWSCVTADYPQYFWLNTAYTYSYQENTVLDVSPEYTVTKAALPAAQTKFNNAVKDLLSGITSSMTQYEIEKTLHDRLILHCQYANASDCYNAYGALVNKTAVCEGIAKAFQHLCRSVGIDTLLVSGKSAEPSSGTEVGHAWNIVKIDGNYYHIDVTWDNAGEPTQDEIHYAWFNVPTEWIGQDHTLTQRGYSYPNCTETKANYFTKNNLVLTNLTVADVVRRSVKKQDSFRFQGYLLNDTDVVRWLNENAAALAREYGLNGYSYTLSSVGKEICIVMSKYQ